MFSDIREFYPTPKPLIDKMLAKVDFKMISSVLEPSAGKGDIVEKVINKFEYAHSFYYNREAKWDIDTIEIDQNLQFILRGQGYRVVFNDFLAFDTFKRYDLIVLNPPFSNGDKHLLKALDMQQNGGQVVCILNAETLKNPFTNARKDLLARLEKYNADVEYIQNSFIYAENKTSVEVALIYVNIPRLEESSIILDELRQQEQFGAKINNGYSNLINADFLKGIVQQYTFEVKAGLKLIAEYKALQPLLLGSFSDEYSRSPIIQLTVSDADKDCVMENAFIKKVRSKYWKALFSSEQFMGLFTSNLRQKYMSKIDDLKDFDFSLYNIFTIKIQLNNEMIKGVENTILNLFEEFSHKHHWYNETSKNILHYNGWKTNKAWKINKKVIIPLRGFNVWDGRIDYDYKVIDKLTDIEKVFNYLDGGITDDIDIRETLKAAEKLGETRKIKLKYFLVSFFKKGTCHIEFSNLELLHKFNLFGSQRKGWLPPTYGKMKYEDMTQEEKVIIDEFEGQESYSKVIGNLDYYIVETSSLKLIA